ncbi:hypothetical protein J8M51_17715 [Streptomyces scabiei]|nr:hypothetical protein [Streptomyces griseiscabiei]
MGAIGRLSFLGVLVGLLVALVPGGSASAGESCEKSLARWLACWTTDVGKGEPYVVLLDQQLSLTGPKGEQDELLDDGMVKDRYRLVVEVPKGGRTGEGGTALLVLAGGRMVHPDAEIDRIPKWAVDKLENVGACVPETLCQRIVETGEQKQPLTGGDLIKLGAVADASTRVPAVAPVPKSPDPTPTKTSTKGGDSGGTEGTLGPEATDSGYGTATWTAFWMSLLLALLLLAFVVVIRRSRGPVAVGHRAPPPGRAAGGGVRGGPARTAPAHAARGGGASGAGGADVGLDGAGGAGGAGADERTTRLRVAPASAPRHGRQVGPRPAHARTAVVRTELHPQGYVEVDRVLRRAVWAEPGRPPPAPGSLVDVTDARERDSDVLYAFPPTAARHAKGTTPPR